MYVVMEVSGRKQMQSYQEKIDRRCDGQTIGFNTLFRNNFGNFRDQKEF